MISKFFYLQLNQPTRGDWVSNCLQDLNKLKITETFEEIKLMTKRKFNRILKERISKNALQYLTEKQGKKGGNIAYVRIEMAEYLLPDSKLSTDQKRQLFAIRNMMVDLPENFSPGDTETLCTCGEREVMSHIYYCRILNKDNSELISYDLIYDGSISEQKKVFYRFQENYEKREKLLTEEREIIQSLKIHKTEKRKKPPCDPSLDPLHCKKFSNG
jgi:hypothetical protein